jgi:hypothetical protein
MTIALREFFSFDGGHRFSGMVENCQRLLTAYGDDALLWSRISNLYQALSEVHPNQEAIRESLHVVKLYARDDAPRILAASVLSTLIGIDKYETLRRIVNGRWGRA